MVAQPFADRTTAHRWATKQRPDKGDRLVLACTECPTTRPSKRRPPRWATVARQVAARPSEPIQQPCAPHSPPPLTPSVSVDRRSQALIMEGIERVFQARDPER